MSSVQPAETTPRKYQLLIDGQWVDAESGKTFATPNPSTGEDLAEVAEADEADINKAVSAARKAFEGKWSKMSARDRGRLLYKLSQLIEEHSKELAELESRDNGKPIRESLYVDLPQVVENFEYFAGWSTKIEGSTIPVPGQMFNYTLREPIGVCGQIIPWNFPLLMAAWKLAPALAAGNTVVLKPAEQTPLTAMELGKLIQEAGFPDGVVNIVPGFGETAGAALAAHPGIDKIAFTGSTEVGKIIAKTAANNLTKVSLELGGKAPNIVFADADLEQAVNGAMMGIFFNQGQVCCAGSRLFLQEDVKDEFLSSLKEKAEKIKVGDPLDKNTLMGPQVSCEQLDRIKSYVGFAQEDGATVFSGGASPELEGSLKNGYFFRPTIFSDVTNSMRVAQEEIFGPVVSVITFKDEDDLLRQANETIYGLSAGIWTRDLVRAHRFAKEIKAGVVWINTYNMFNAASPFGGYKQSGYGREMGKQALELYTQTKSVWVDLSGKPIGWFGK
ncbi:MAG TPA: aldehyde dehydrogenase family protein [Pyrinomonadaceae bacterium]|jgi:betaine-aldehyde dehydrogenase|nr:aldehyde dehydrogenase family protein [Pyrinomonadaceae bacterium]